MQTQKYIHVTPCICGYSFSLFSHPLFSASEVAILLVCSGIMCMSHSHLLGILCQGLHCNHSFGKSPHTPFWLRSLVVHMQPFAWHAMLGFCLLTCAATLSTFSHLCVSCAGRLDQVNNRRIQRLQLCEQVRFDLHGKAGTGNQSIKVETLTCYAPHCTKSLKPINYDGVFVSGVYAPLL